MSLNYSVMRSVIIFAQVGWSGGQQSGMTHTVFLKTKALEFGDAFDAGRYVGSSRSGMPSPPFRPQPGCRLTDQRE